ncbi:IS3 family transposase [Saccharothrix sp. NRRL B-16314]|uniref:IS3 family transposase n=1 Tax=Saccharothrix sp. NRRL B-16314 TaxID=1463825 RepID=UPI0007C5665E|nr:IS3 family transposase [Saccharothrix sp. NRRL B-16314]
MIDYIDRHKQEFGVEPICRVLRQAGERIAPSAYYAAKTRPASARSVRDERLKSEIEAIWRENYEVYGARKIWFALRRKGITVARCTVERLMPRVLFDVGSADSPIRDAPLWRWSKIWSDPRPISLLNSVHQDRKVTVP